MIRKFLTITLAAASLSAAEAQSKFKFGVHIDPTVTFMGSNDKAVERDGSNLAFRFGMQGDLYFGENGSGEDKTKGTYALTFGTGFVMGAGGKLNFRDGGKALLNSDLDKTSYQLASGNRPSYSNTDTAYAFGAGTTVKYAVNYVPISAGFKITTAELGQSYIRAFFHLPTIDILIPVSARGTINAPQSGIPSDIQDPINRNRFAYTDGDVKKENIYGDIIPLQFAAGVGAGVEWSPNSDGGIRLIGGLYYSAAVLDMTKKIELYDPLQTLPTERFVSKNPTNRFQSIALRVGVVF